MDECTFAYARISLDRGKTRSGVERQLEDTRRLEAELGWTPAREFVDNSRSAWQPDAERPQYAAMLEAIREARRAGRPVRILLFKLDRLYRQPIEFETDLVPLAGSGGSLWIATTETMPLDIASPAGLQQARNVINVAAYYSHYISHNGRRQRAAKRTKGLPPGSGPRAFGWLDWTTPHPEEAAALREAFEAIAAGSSPSDVARQWNERGILGVKGAPWSVGRLIQTLRRPRHAALVAYGGGARHGWNPHPEIVADGKWQPIIPPELWRHVIDILEPKRERRPPHVGAFSTLFVCGRCGKTMYQSGGYPQENRPGIRLRVWHCYRDSLDGPRRDACGRSSIAANSAETVVLGALYERVDNLDLAAMIQADGQPNGHEDGLRLRELRRLDEEADLDYEGGTITKELRDSKLARHAREREGIYVRRGEHAAASVLAPYAGKPGTLRAAWEGGELSDDRKRAILKAVLGRVTIQPASRQGAKFDPGRLVFGG
jgi:DNA invertase Pin-like site-specific DNA recombinase